MRIFLAVPSRPSQSLRNSSSAFATTVVVEPHPSVLVLAFWALGHALSIISLLWAGPPPFSVLIAAALGAHGWLRLPQPPPAAVIEIGACWTVPDWGVVAALPGSGSFSSPWLIRVMLAAGGRRRAWVLTRDGVRPDQWRRLRALLAR